MREWIARRRAALCEPIGPREYAVLALALGMWALVLGMGLSRWVVIVALGLMALCLVAYAALLVGLGPHRYLSTGCLHRNHEHCRSTVAADGHTKTPGTCKFCTAVCVCPCHREETTDAR